MKKFAFTLMMIGVVLLQSLVVPRWFPYSWTPHLLLTIALVVTVLKGRSTGMTLAILGGIVQDVIIGNFFGLHVVSYALHFRVLAVYDLRRTMVCHGLVDGLRRHRCDVRTTGVVVDCTGTC